ncbi:MAG: hypothetical protein IPO82_01140 [Betaproteobacteria bacterium]|jgi:hypothetical protein|nr:hypothetical protein [Betaproteobacteria bacterium]MBL0292061.1 hypothetical protein [Betaproteobacteria bacterium]
MKILPSPGHAITDLRIGAAAVSSASAVLSLLVHPKAAGLLPARAQARTTPSPAAGA